MRLLQLNQWRQRSCTSYGWKARHNGRGIWLYYAGIRQGSSDFFSFSDDYKIFALRDSKPSPLNEPSQRIQTLLCSADSPLLRSPQQRVHRFPAAIRQLSLTRTLYKRANFAALLQMPRHFCKALLAADRCVSCLLMPYFSAFLLNMHVTF